MQSLTEINATMQEDFIQRVHQYRQNKDLSKPIRICMEQLRSRMEESITLEDLAKEFGYSTYYLSKKFKAETGQTFKEYLRSIRLERAKFLLRSIDLSILRSAKNFSSAPPAIFPILSEKPTVSALPIIANRYDQTSAGISLQQFF
jgi:YesN/AraC family two-component response regulator